jgi:hypothetical protein
MEKICTSFPGHKRQQEKRTLKYKTFSYPEVLDCEYKFNSGKTGNLIDFQDRDEPYCRKSKITGQDKN